MMAPELVLKALERSKSLRGLRRHKLRPLDKPLIPFSDSAGAYDGAAFADDASALDSAQGD